MKKLVAHSLTALAGIGLCVSFDSAYVTARAQSTDALVAVVNNASPPVSELTKPEVRRLLLGQSSKWYNGSKVVVVIEPAGNKDRSILLQKVCGMTEAEYTRFELQAAFTGRAGTALHEVTTTAAAKSFVMAYPGAIAFMHPNEVDHDLKVVLTIQ